MDVSVSAGLFESKSAARRTLKQGGVYMRIRELMMRIRELKGKVLFSLQARRTKWSSESPKFLFLL